MLVDGVRLNAGTSGAAAIGGIALDTIDRIEIVRGNLSSLYGSSAVGGVVQIFTRAGSERGVTLSAEGGQGRTLNGRVSGGHGHRVHATGRRARRRHHRGVFRDRSGARGPERVRAGANADIDGNDYLTASLGATYRAGDTLVAVNGWLNRNRTEFDSTADGPDATHLEKSQLAAANALARTA